MSPPKRSPTGSSPSRQQLEIAAALATERLMSVHFRYALELVERTGDQLDPGRALAIYGRLHNLRDVDLENLHHRIFVALGQEGQRKPEAGGEPREPGEARPETPRSVVGAIRRRLRGRVNLELREWIEFHTGRAETELLWAHVENALLFTELFAPSRDIGEAVSTYAAQLGLLPSRTEMVYYLTLAHLSGNPLVSMSEESGALAPAASDSRRPSLRIGDSGPPSSRRQAG